ncbi:MAG: hypothetical protein ACRD4C_04000 [Candidatus Acidiferrales bacterium]
MNGYVGAIPRLSDSSKVTNGHRIYSLDSRRSWPALAYDDRLPALPRHALAGLQMMAWAGV